LAAHVYARTSNSRTASVRPSEMQPGMEGHSAISMLAPIGTETRNEPYRMERKFILSRLIALRREAGMVNLKVKVSHSAPE
jgi:hypothetical protein